MAKHLFSVNCALLAKNTRGGGYPLEVKLEDFENSSESPTESPSESKMGPGGRQRRAPDRPESTRILMLRVRAVLAARREEEFDA
jgi:hypothetical protein